MILKPRDVGWLLPIVFMLLILIAIPIAEASPESLKILKRVMNAREDSCLCRHPYDCC